MSGRSNEVTASGESFEVSRDLAKSWTSILFSRKRRIIRRKPLTVDIARELKSQKGPLKEGKKRLLVEEREMEVGKRKIAVEGTRDTITLIHARPKNTYRTAGGLQSRLGISLHFQVHFDLDFALCMMQISSPRMPTSDHYTLYSLSEADCTFIRTP